MKNAAPAALMQAVIDGKLDYTIADSVAVSLFQRVHPELAVALDITDEQPVTWFSAARRRQFAIGSHARFLQ